MSLQDLPLARRYRGTEDDVLGRLYVPCLSQSVRYSRAVGYFSASALSIAARGLGPFVRQGGEMRLIASPDLTGVDPELINEALAERERVIGETMTETLIAGASSGSTRERLGLLGWLVAKGRLDLKVAVLDSDVEAGIYHEKLGLFEDAEGNTVAFHGSSNESRRALLLNFESVMVFRSWKDHEAEDVAGFVEDFAALWEDRTPGLRIFDFPEATRRELIGMAPDELSDEDPPIPATDEPSPLDVLVGQRPATPRLPQDISLRSYQRDALRTWFSSDARGILEMATGTGKTLTALSAVERLYSAAHERGRSLFVLVVCPYQHLVTQWAQAAAAFGIQPILCYRSRSLWFSDLTASLQALHQGAAPFRLAIATNATFQTDAFQGVIRGMPRHSLLIADEVHNLGAEVLREALPHEALYRMGLSATPERHFDEEGTASLENYFGPVVFRFGLEEAISAGALTRYDYGVSVVELTGDELDRYLELTHAIARAIGASGLEGIGGGAAKHLLIARARVVANASGKLPALRRAIAPFQNDGYNLVYCGDGTPEHDTGIEATRQIEGAVMLLGRELGMRVQPYTAETAVDDREHFRARFEKGELQALVAIRCLDEGVDIPATRRAFILASSSNPRQFIQRRGRVLRPAPETGKEAAYIHDFIAVPPADAVDDEIKETERRLVGRELERVIRFAELARNGPSAIEELSELRDRYQLLHL